MLLQAAPGETVPAASLSVPVRLDLSKSVEEVGSTPGLVPVGGYNLHNDNLKSSLFKFCTGALIV